MTVCGLRIMMMKTLFHGRAHTASDRLQGYWTTRATKIQKQIISGRFQFSSRQQLFCRRKADPYSRSRTPPRPDRQAASWVAYTGRHSGGGRRGEKLACSGHCIRVTRTPAWCVGTLQSVAATYNTHATTIPDTASEWVVPWGPAANAIPCHQRFI